HTRFSRDWSSDVCSSDLGEEAALPVEVERGLRVPLGELLVALAHHVRQVAEGRGPLGDAQLGQRLVQGDLARGGGEQVLAAQDEIGRASCRQRVSIWGKG